MNKELNVPVKSTPLVIVCGPGAREVKANGLCFIGDPHVSSRRPGRRVDDFTKAVITKLAKAIHLCNVNNWVPVILGDLLDREDEDDQALLVQLIRVFNNSIHPVFTLVGNHEIKQAQITDDTMIAALRESQSILTIEGAGYGFDLLVKGRRFIVGGSAYGYSIPSEVKVESSELVEGVIWLTHHDLGFDGCYPGADPITEIKGVNMSVNGHMHKWAPSVEVGEMIAHNPGNITRMSVDTKDHVPKVWSWEPSAGWGLTGHVIEHQKEVFDMSGYLIDAAPVDQEIEAAKLLQAQSMFKYLLKNQMVEDRQKTPDAVFIKEQMEGLFTAKGVDIEIQSDLMQLLEEAVRRNTKDIKSL